MRQWTMECGEHCSSSAVTEISDEDADSIPHAAGDRKRHSRKEYPDALKFIKRSAEPCGECGASTVVVNHLPTDTKPTCDTCQLASWASGVCSACGDMQVMPQALKRCPDQFFCDACDAVK